ncbi:hypothetical protein Asd1617_02389 [Shigella dysenteriae 1617]|uniref:Uncharacterized protein n=2 Tax=Shigella dysenteriae 1617 TaxID=754093 RepID=A0A0A6ZU91_SHIDY|nr:hypothetical protein Asd1617_02389 [Shigella dysenteriae 1617]
MSFLKPDDGVNANFQCPGGIANPGAIEGHFSEQLFNARLTGLISVNELKTRWQSRQRNLSWPLGFRNSLYH